MTSGSPATMLLPMAESTQGYLFDGNSIEQYSPVFTVPFGGSGVLLRAYGLGKSERVGKRLAKQQHVIVNMVRAFIKNMPHRNNTGCACPDDVFIWKPQDTEIAYEECVRQCGMWSLYNAQNLVVLSVPGEYRLVMSDQEAVGSVVVEAIRLGAESMKYIPSDLFLGKVP